MTFIMGKNTVKEVIKHKPDIVKTVFVSENVKRDTADLLRKNNIPIQTVNKKILSSYVKSDSHQGYVAVVKSRNYMDIKEFIEKSYDKEQCFVLIVDSIFDPQNFGSILRTAECFGVDLVVFSKNRGAEITPVVTKAACGATELLNISKVSNLAQTVDLFKKEGFDIAASVLDKKSVDINDFEYSKKTVLIVGSEGEGVQPLLIKKSDHLIKIPMIGKLQSLNVSQASSVLLYKRLLDLRPF